MEGLAAMVQKQVNKARKTAQEINRELRDENALLKLQVKAAEEGIDRYKKELYGLRGTQAQIDVVFENLYTAAKSFDAGAGVNGSTVVYKIPIKQYRILREALKAYERHAQDLQRGGE